MTHTLLSYVVRRAFLVLVFLALTVPVSAQSSENLTILSNFGRGDGESRTVFALGTRAYYGIGNRVEITDFSDPTNPVTLGSASVADRVEDVVAVGNTLYVSSGASVHIFNVQNPTQIAALGTVAADSYGEGLAVDPPYILFGDGSAGLRILDATDPANPMQVAQVDTLGYVEGVSYSGDVAYVSAGSRIHLIDYSTPASPTYAGRIEGPLDYFQSTAVRGSFLYIADFFGGFRVFNVSDPANPSDVGFFDPADRTARITLDGDFAYAANGDKGVTILNISDPANPTEVAVMDTPTRALQAWVSGTLVYIADTEGIQVFDISDPANPTFQSSIDVQSPADGKAFGINTQGDYAYVAYGDAGLRILDISNPAGLTQVAQVDVTNDAGEGQARQVAVSGDYAYVAARSAGVKVVDISDPANPSVVTTVEVSDAGDVAVDGDKLVVAGGSGITVFDLTDPANPAQLFASDGLGYSDRVGVSGNYAYAITTGSNVRVFDISDPSNISLTGTVETGGDYSEGRIVVQDNLLFTTNGDLLIVDTSDKANPQVVGTYDAPSYSYSVNVLGDYAYVATEREGIRLVDVSDPANPVEVGFADPGDQMRDVAFQNGIAFTANGESGVTAIQNDLATTAEEVGEVPSRIVLHQNYPNPFNPSTTIQFELRQTGEVTVQVYNMLGQHVQTLLKGSRTAGRHTVSFDATGLGSGTYLYQIEADGQQVSRQMILVK